MMRKMILILLLLCFSSVGSAEEYKGEVVNVYSMKATVLSGELYATNGEGKYEGYKKLNGYPGQNAFQVYFQGDGNSYSVSVEDLSGIDLDERISWQHEGKQCNNSRKEIYNLLSDLHKLKPDEDSRKWMNDTFGQVYLDWISQGLITEDASRLVGKYKQFARGEKPYDRFATAKIKIQ